MKSLGIEPTKYGIIQINYNEYLSRGDNPEDDKYYSKIISISYERLAMLSMLKLQNMEHEYTNRLDSLEKRLLELEQKGW